MPARTNPLLSVPRTPKPSRAILNDSGKLGLMKEANSAADVVIVSVRLFSVWKSVEASSSQPTVDIVWIGLAESMMSE